MSIVFSIFGKCTCIYCSFKCVYEDLKSEADNVSFKFLFSLKHVFPSFDPKFPCSFSYASHFSLLPLQ